MPEAAAVERQEKRGRMHCGRPVLRERECRLWELWVLVEQARMEALGACWYTCRDHIHHPRHPLLRAVVEAEEGAWIGLALLELLLEEAVEEQRALKREVEEGEELRVL